jgi:hypothetical protein
MQPRWTPTYAEGVGEALDDKFLGYANDLDVWFDDFREVVIAVGPKQRLIREDINFDAFDIIDGTLKIQDGPKDLHIDVHDMCLIYALCVEKGVLDEKG